MINYTKCVLLLLLSTLSMVVGEKCDQTPPQATVATPSETRGVFKLSIESNKHTLDYMSDQTYVVTLMSVTDRPFRSFMITAEDPNVDNSNYEIGPSLADVGTLKIPDSHIGKKSKYSDRCPRSVENTDISDKTKIEIHWRSPKHNDDRQTVRLRATVAENEEVWYSGDEDEELVVILTKDHRRARDSPPLDPTEICDICSEARYEVIFEGQWSRLRHPLHYPSKPDENGYSHMIGASHAYKYYLWKQGQPASAGLTDLAVKSDISAIENEIISNMELKYGTRTLIKGKRRHHPEMSEPSHALFRVDRIHHLFSIAVGMRPSPDWFLGTSQFELCYNKSGDWQWLADAEIPLYPWDAGVQDGVSYESEKATTTPTESIRRVEVGSFNKASPFYQKNLKDLHPFAILKVRRLNVYPNKPEDCQDDEGQSQSEEEMMDEKEPEDNPQVMESRQPSRCGLSEWSEWSQCVPSDGLCGRGVQTRTRSIKIPQVSHFETSSDCDEDISIKEHKKYCFVDCNNW